MLSRDGWRIMLAEHASEPGAVSYLHPRRPVARAPAETLALVNLCASLAALSRRQQPTSLARRLYEDSWRRLLAGEGTRATMLATLAEALAATRLGDLDSAGLARLGVAAPAAAQARLRAFATAAMPVEAELRLALRLQLPGLPAPALALPDVLAVQAERPPGAALGESLAEHSLRLALLAALLATETGAAAEVMFLGALAQPLPMALPELPDALAAEVAAARAALAVPGSAAARAMALALAGGPSLLPVSLYAA
jgi:hypothetical protein